MFNTTIALEEMHFYAFHGWYPEEQKMGNDYYLSVRCTLIDHSAIHEDIDNTVNYETLYQLCAEQMKQPCKLLETVTESILKRIKDEYKQVATAKVILKKTQPQVGGKVKYSVIEMSF